MRTAGHPISNRNTPSNRNRSNSLKTRDITIPNRNCIGSLRFPPVPRAKDNWSQVTHDSRLLIANHSPLAARHRLLLIGPPVIRIRVKPLIFNTNCNSNRHKTPRPPTRFSSPHDQRHEIPPEAHRPARQFLIVNRKIRKRSQPSQNQQHTKILIVNHEVASASPIGSSLLIGSPVIRIWLKPFRISVNSGNNILDKSRGEVQVCCCGKEEELNEWKARYGMRMTHLNGKYGLL